MTLEMASMVELIRDFQSPGTPKTSDIFNRHLHYRCIISASFEADSILALWEKLDRRNVFIDGFIMSVQYVHDIRREDKNGDKELRVPSTFVAKKIRFLILLRFVDISPPAASMFGIGKCIYRLEHTVIALPLNHDVEKQHIEDVYSDYVQRRELRLRYYETGDEGFVNKYMELHDPPTQIMKMLEKRTRELDERIDELKELIKQRFN